MMRNSFFTLTLFILCQFAAFAQSDNRFVEMSKKTKAEYRFELLDYLDESALFDMKRVKQEVKLLNDFEAICEDKEWKGVVELLHILFDDAILYRDSNAIECNNADIHSRLLKIYNQSDDEYLRLRALRAITQKYWGASNYEFAFENSLLLCKLIENIPDSCFPDKLSCYIEIANKYYYFKEYNEAIVWHNKVANAIENIHPSNQKNVLSAYNGLGLCYRHKDDLATSDFYFKQILTYKSEIDEWLQDIWQGIAKGNLGYNLYLKEKYDEAIPLFEFGMSKTVQYDDFGYASGTAINLANTYLKKGIFNKAYYYGNLAYDYERKMSRTGRLESIYFFFNKYYTATHNTRKALLYLDSAVNEQTKNNALFSANKLLRVEQRANLLEQQAKDKDIAIAQKQASIYLRNFILIAIFSFFILLLLFFLFNLYRKKQSAYQALVTKSQQWANVRKEEVEEQLPETDKIEDTTNNVKDIDIVSLMEMVYRALEQQQIYKDSDLSIQSMAELLKTNRNYLSKAINSTTGNNFNAFINEYRIKEAIKILSDPKLDHLSTDLLAEKVGFANRFTFSIAFKKSIGITPAEFKRNRDIE